MAKLKLLNDAALRPNVEYAAAKRNIMLNKRNGKYATEEEYIQVRNRLTAAWMRRVY